MQQIKTLTLPVAMLAGFLFSGFLARLNPVTPYMIFVMLFVTFCRISPRDLRFSPMFVWLLLIQVLGAVALYLGLSIFGEVAAEGVMMCVFAPTAVSSVVIGSMLGANVATMASYSLVSNTAVAVVAPVFFSFVGRQADMPFIESFLHIFSRVGPLLILPFAVAFLLQKVAPRAHDAVRRRQIISFYIWAVSLMIVTGQTVEFVKAQDGNNYALEICIAAGAFVICILQFALGRRIGGRYGDTVAGGQSLGQKNTVLAIWMSQTYMHPLASIGPASYVLWQNIVNSWQLWVKNRRDAESSGGRRSPAAGSKSSPR